MLSKHRSMTLIESIKEDLGKHSVDSKSLAIDEMQSAHKSVISEIIKTVPESDNVPSDMLAIE